MRVNDRYTSFYYQLDEDLGEVMIDPAKTALLVIDMQKVFLTRPAIQNATEVDSLNAKRWEPFYQKIDGVVVPNNQRILNACRNNGVEVCFAQIQCRKEDGRDRSLVHKATGFNELLLPPGSEDSQIVQELSPEKDELILTKTTDSAVTGTSLRLILQNMGIDSVIVTGVFTDQCVSGTVRSLADESFHVWLIEDACMAATEGIHKNELEILNNIYCHVINTEELLAALGC